MRFNLKKRRLYFDTSTAERQLWIVATLCITASGVVVLASLAVARAGRSLLSTIGRAIKLAAASDKNIR
jgi:predicted cobalt transporter CbtA